MHGLMRSKSLYLELVVMNLNFSVLIISQLTKRFLIYDSYIPKPSSTLANLRLKSEEGWLNLGQDLGLSNYVFRLGGIYGPGRRLNNSISISDVSVMNFEL